MNSLATSTIPAYAHPVHSGADGIVSRKVNGPRTEAQTSRRARAAAAYTAATAKPAPKFTAADYLAAAS